MPSVSHRVTLCRSSGTKLNFSALTNVPSARQAQLKAAGITQDQIDALANADIWVDAYGVASDTGYTTPALIGDPIASAYDNATGNLWSQPNAANRPTLAAGPAIAGGYAKTLSGITTANTTTKVVIATANGILVADANISANSTIPNITNTVHWISGNLSSADIEKIKVFAVAEGAIDNNFSGISNFNDYFRNASFLTSFPLINTAAGTNFFAAWFGCSGLQSFPLINTSLGTDFPYAWYNCSGLQNFPLIDTSSGTNFRYAWRNCSGLQSFPLIDTSLGTNFSAAWRGCSGLQNFPLIDTSSGTSFSSAWQNCSGLQSFPLIDTSSGTSFSYAWRNCLGLQSFPENFFNGCNATNFTLAFTNTALTQSSIDGILVSINSNGTSNGTFDQSGGSAPSATGEAAIDAMRSRGWTITVTGGY